MLACQGYVRDGFQTTHINPFGQKKTSYTAQYKCSEFNQPALHPDKMPAIPKPFPLAIA